MEKEVLPPIVLDEFGLPVFPEVSAEEAEKNLRELIAKHAIPPEELERREQAVRRMRERHLHIPWYKKKDEEQGMDFWRHLHASCVLSDGYAVSDSFPIPEDPKERR